MVKVRRSVRLVLIAGLGAAGIAGWILHSPPGVPGGLRSVAFAAADDTDPPVAWPPYDPQLAGELVAFWEKRVRDDPEGAIAFRELAGALLARQRESGEIADAVAAERAARRSVEILPRNNAGGWSRLARSLLAQHRFPEALAAAERAAALDPQAQRLRADILLELGDVAAAERALAAVPSQPDDLNAMALRARILEVRGEADRALGLMREASRLADDQSDLPHETVAWYHTMVGHALIDRGRLEEGERSCRRALEIFPNDYRAMTGMAEAAAWRGDWQEVVAWGGKALRLSAQNPEALRLAGEAYAAMGQDQEAQRQDRLLEELAHSFPSIYDRHWARFCADRGRNLDEALTLARRDLELRRDVLAYDTLAWVCFKKGLLEEAAATMHKALASGIQDAELFQHAGAIAQATGDHRQAETAFARARSLNPHLMKARAGAAADSR